MGSSNSTESSGGGALDLLIFGGIIILLGFGAYALYEILGTPIQWIKGAEETVSHWYDDIHILPTADPKTGKPASTGDQITNLVTWLFPLPKIVYQVVTGEQERGKFDYAGLHSTKDQQHGLR